MKVNNIDDLYSGYILDHCRHPRNHNFIENYDVSGHDVNPFCGDEVDLQLVLDNGRVSGVGVQSVGCSINQASASMLSEVMRPSGRWRNLLSLTTLHMFGTNTVTTQSTGISLA